LIACAPRCSGSAERTGSAITGTGGRPGPSVQAMTIDLAGPFRGSEAVAARLLTPAVLRGPRYRRLFPDIYVAAWRELDHALLSLAAYLLVAGRGVLAGYSAAELLNASCGPPGAPATVLMIPGQQRRRCPGLVVRRGQLDPAETTWWRGCRLTTPVRTAFDLARWAPTLVEKVVAVDALAYRHRITVDVVREFARRHSGVHGSADLPRVLALANPLAESPMETRIRLALVLAGLPVPAVQHRVRGFGRSHRLDLAYPDVLLAIEYDGANHLDLGRARRDLAREAVLTRLGWTVLRFDAHTVLHDPDRVVAVVRAELRRRGVDC
jgi:very-short-patch-repair endonuclease